MESKLYINAFSALGQWMKEPSGNNWDEIINKAWQQNQWFTPANIRQALAALGRMLEKERLGKWMNAYTPPSANPMTIGLIMAGNIPLVGFHDLLCVLVSGHRVQVKMSSDDQVLLPYIVNKLCDLEPALADRVSLVDKLSGFEAAIATGSNNTARHFEYYLRNVPHLIRRNRSSIAVLSGKETDESIKELGKDIFSYFGLGCRNVSKLYIPAGYDIAEFYRPLEIYSPVIDHNKYANNYTYHKALFLMNVEKIYDNNFLLLKESKNISSPVSVCYYEYYNDADELEKELISCSDEIQCMVSECRFSKLAPLPFGQSQCPGPEDYADGKDTMKWLKELS